MSQKTPNASRDRKSVSKNVTIAPDSIAIIFNPVPPKSQAGPGGETDASSASHHHRHTARNGKELFKELQRENKHSVWNKSLAESIRGLTLVGTLEPWTILVRGSDDQLDTLRSAYSRRVLKPPRNFTISNLGDVPSVELWPVQQAQFIPLTEVLCLLVSEMNRRKLVATQDTVRKKLSECYDKMPVPSPEIIHKSLTYLMHEGKIQHNGSGYFITKGDEVPPDTTDAESVATFTTFRAKRKDEKPKETEKEKDKPREYLVYKDGILTKHTFPVNVSDDMGMKSKLEATSTRPLSYPANHGLSSIPEDAVMMQRSMSMRERRSPQKKSKFDRTSSMRLPNDISFYDQGYLTSDSEAKPSCLGRLLGRTVPKKPKASAYAPVQPLQTFSAQFPPSDIHDPFFNFSHWMKNTPEKLGTNKPQNDPQVAGDAGVDQEKPKVLEASTPKHTYSPKMKRKSLPKELSNVKTSSHYAIEHGRLTQTAKFLQQKYQDGHEESMPESEAEFVKPTKMFDGKHRTKAVADQKPVAAAKNPHTAVTDGKDSKIKHYFSSMDRSRPVNPKPYQGLTSESSLAGSDSELEMNPRRRAAANEKRLLKQRHADLLRDRRQGRLFSSQRGDSLGSVSRYGKQPVEEVPVRLNDNGWKAVTQYEKHKSRRSRRWSSEEDLGNGILETHQEHDEQLVTTSRKICVAFQDSGKMVVKTATHQTAGQNADNQVSQDRDTNSRVKIETEQLTESTTLEKVRMRKHDLIIKRPHSSHETFYKDDEIEKLLAEELQTEKKSPQSKINHSEENNKGSNLQKYPEILDHCHEQPVNGRLERSSVQESFTSSSTSRGYSDASNPPSIMGRTVSTDSAINGSCASIGYRQPLPVHSRMESLSSSTGDSGFNSPRSSLNNNYPSKQTSSNSLNTCQSSSSIPVLVRPIPRRGYSNTAIAKVAPTDKTQSSRPLSSTSDQSSSSDLTIKSIKERRRSGSDQRDGDSSSSEKSGHSSRSKRLSRVKSYEVIGTV